MKAKQLPQLTIPSTLLTRTSPSHCWPTIGSLEAIAQARLAIPEFSAAQGMLAEFPWLALIATESANGQDTAAHADLQTFLATARTWAHYGRDREVAVLRRQPETARRPAPRRRVPEQ